MALLLAVVMALIPLAIAPGWFFYFDVTPKVVLLLLGTAAAAIWWAATGGAAGFYRASRAALGFAYLVAACCAGRPRRLHVLLRSIAASGLIVALYGIAQYFGWDPLLDARGYHVGDGIWTIVRPPSTLGHADYSANWLLFVVFAGAALAVSEQRTPWRWLAWSAAAAGSVAIVLSGTRAAIAGLLAGALFLILMSWWGRRFRLPYVALGLAIAAVAALFYLSPAGEKLR